MRKIMLVIDDFNELQFLETVLRRLGFDVLSLSKDLSVASSILGFFPDLVMAQAKSRSVDGLVLSQKIRRLAPQARMVLLHPPGQAPKLTAETRNYIDAFLELPVDTSKLVSMVAQLGNMDENVLTEKINKIAAGQMSEERRARLQGKGSLQSGGQVSVTGEVQKPQSQNVHVTSKNPSGKQDHNFGSGSETVINKVTNSGSGASDHGIHHIHGTNKIKSPTHISGEKVDTGPAYDPTGNQESRAGQKGAAYVPTNQESGNPGGSASIANSESSDRTRRYNEFLKAHDEPVDRTLSQAELKKIAKEYKLDNLDGANELEQKREFVRALFRK